MWKVRLRRRNAGSRKSGLREGSPFWAPFSFQCRAQGLFGDRTNILMQAKQSPDPRVRVAISLGSNLGDRFANLHVGCTALRHLLTDARVSGVFETFPMYFEDQPSFLNACCVGVTRLPPRELLAYTQSIERMAGRARRGGRYGPRTLDLDLLLYGDKIVQTPSLTIPHPRLVERAFVLIPLAEIAGRWPVPGTQWTIEQAAARVGADGVRRLDQKTFNEMEIVE